jgi:hypothetical protein
MGTLLTRNHSYRTAKQFKELFSSNSHRIYAVIGNTANSQSESTPTESLSSDISFWDKVAGIKRITSADVSMVVKHGSGSSLKELDSGIGFTPYNHTLDLFGSPTEFLGYTEGTTYIRVWKCLFNGSGATVSDVPASSDSSPSGNDDSNTGVFIQSDGYHWKYLYSFAKTSVFNTNDTNFKWMPVESLQLKPSNADLLKQWNTQAAAVDGAVNSIIHSSNLTGYTNGDAVTLTGDGSGFAGEIATANSKQHVSITTAGTGYRSVTAVNVDGSADSSLSAMISPISGHGFDVEREVGAKDLMVTCQITNSDIARATVTQYATVALILDPIITGSSQDDITTSGTSIASGTRASDTSYLQAGLLKYSGQILYVDQRATVARTNDSNTDLIRLVIQF